MIAAGQRAGLSLDEIRELLTADQRGVVSSRLQELAQRKLPEIEDLIANIDNKIAAEVPDVTDTFWELRRRPLSS